MSEHIHIGNNLREKLVHAAGEGHDECVAELIKAGADVNAKRWRYNALHRCIECCQVYREGIEKGVEVAGSNRNYGRCLDLLLEAGAEINNKYLNDVARDGNVEFVEKLVKAGADVNETDNYTFYDVISPLKAAVRGGNEECVRFLLEAGADPNGLPPGHSTPLSEALWKGHEQFVALLLNAGANVNAFVNIKHQTVLFRASSGSGWSKKVLQQLIDLGSNVNIKDTMGQTPLFFGAYDPDLEKIKILIEAGADVNAADKDGNTVLHNLARNCGDASRLKSVKLFLKCRCFINKTNHMGRNALAEHIVDTDCHDDPQLRKLLFAAGETFDGRIPEGYEPLPEDPQDMSLKSKCRRMPRTHLLKLNANVNLFLRIPQLGLPTLLRDDLLYDVSIDDEND